MQHQPCCCISVEAFLWHPHSIKYSIEESKYTYNDQLLMTMDSRNDDDSDNAPSNLRVELPPRLVVAGKHSYDLQRVAEQWASRRRYRVVAFGHVVACSSSRGLWFVDFVLEKTVTRQQVPQQQQKDERRYALACVYYSQCRGGRDLQLAKDYMKNVQQVCNEQMQFFPRMIALCAYDRNQASAFFCGGSGGSSQRRRSRLMLGRFDMQKTAAWRAKRNRTQQPKVYATDVTVL